ncbi:DMT family transporter [Salisaeta longa]|uniref:DMT family transporter n=1 Tax=Salisaeta longa TaxID=503170 RepID=UPI0003B2FBB0|nr:DMT family transporter [Salisaeta longa]
MFVLLALVNGLLSTASRMVNAALSARVGSLDGSWINHVMGALGAAALLLVGFSTGTLWAPDVPWVYYSGGAIGLFMVTASNYAVRKVGAVLFAVLMLMAQLSVSAAIDHWGWLGDVRLPLSPLRACGLLLVMAGAGLVMRERRMAIQNDSALSDAETR